MLEQLTGEVLAQYGAYALPIIGLAFIAWSLWRRLINTQDARIADQKEHAGQLVQTIKTVEKLLDRFGGRHGS